MNPVRIHQPSQEPFVSFSPRIAKTYDLANQNLCYFQVFLIIERSGEQDSERY